MFGPGIIVAGSHASECVSNCGIPLSNFQIALIIGWMVLMFGGIMLLAVGEDLYNLVEEKIICLSTQL